MTRIIFMGTPEFACPSLVALLDAGYDVAAVVTQPDREAGRGRQVAVSPVKQLAQTRGLLVLQPARVRRPAMIEELRTLTPEMIVVVAYGQILPAEIINLPPYGCINVHASLLPRHRGASPIQAAILAGDTTTGITIIQMDTSMDTGPILSQSSLEIAPGETAATLGERLAHLGGEALIQTLPAWLAGQIVPQPQDDTQATYCRPLHKEDGRLDWHQPADALERQVRAMHPWPGAYTTFAGRLLKVLVASVGPTGLPAGPAGLVVPLPGPAAAVCAGNGHLILHAVQLEGRRPLPIAAFLAGQRTFLGTVLR